jgi:hypothetical protein
MALYALVSPGGSPGVTTTALALTLTWPSPVLLAECDPSGGDVLPGLFAGHLPARTGLLNLAFEAGRGPATAAAELARQLVALDESGTRMLLAGLTDPRQAPLLAPSWPALAAALAAYPGDVIADCGRLDASDGQPLSVLTVASRILLVMRPSLRQVARAKARIDMLSQLLGGTGRVALLLAGKGSHDTREIARALARPVAGTLPQDPATAQVLSDGEGRRRGLSGRPLLRSAQATARSLRETGGAAAPAAPALSTSASGGPR